MTNATGNIASTLSFEELQLVIDASPDTPGFEAIAEFDGMEKYPEIPQSQAGSIGPKLTFTVSLYAVELSGGPVAAVLVYTGADDGYEDVLDGDMVRVFPLAELKAAREFYERCILDFESNWADIIG